MIPNPGPDRLFPRKLPPSSGGGGPAGCLLGFPAYGAAIVITLVAGMTHGLLAGAVAFVLGFSVMVGVLQGPLVVAGLVIGAFWGTAVFFMTVDSMYHHPVERAAFGLIVALIFTAIGAWCWWRER